MRKCKLAWRITTLLLTLNLWLPLQSAAHGFTADRVRLTRELTGKYRVQIWYTHLEIGERRLAHIDFDEQNKAQEAFVKLQNGGEFFLGNIENSIHFHEIPQKKKPW